MPTINYYWLQHSGALEVPWTTSAILATIVMLIIVGAIIYVGVKL